MFGGQIFSRLCVAKALEQDFFLFNRDKSSYNKQESDLFGALADMGNQNLRLVSTLR